MDTAKTLVIFTIKSFSSSFSLTIVGFVTINLKIPNSEVSAIDKALILIFNFSIISSVCNNLPSLFENIAISALRDGCYYGILLQVDKKKIVLNEAIKDGGSTIKSFQSSHGVDGLFQQKLKVYGKVNQRCEVCNELIVKTFVKQRGTHYCPNCQKG